MSVAHIEEYYKACKNDVGKKNETALKDVMIKLSKKGVILNPAENSRIHAVYSVPSEPLARSN